MMFMNHDDNKEKKKDNTYKENYYGCVCVRTNSE